MKIAVTYSNGKITDRFGKAKAFKFYEAENGIVTESSIQELHTDDHDEKAAILRDAAVDTLICGNICLDCQEAVGKAGIRIAGCVSGDADAAAEAFAAGTLEYETDPQILK